MKWPDSEAISFKVQARDPDEAFELLAKSMGYLDYQSMCGDLNYQGGDFSVAVLADDRGGHYDQDSDRANVNRQRDSVVLSGFKHLRRMAANQ
jgi:hypothetical protein